MDYDGTANENLIKSMRPRYEELELSELPTTGQLEREKSRTEHTTKSRHAFLVSSVLLIVLALAILVAAFWAPMLKVYGTSMNPTLKSGDIVVLMKTQDIQTGDIIAFNSDNKILIKRVIAKAGDTVSIDAGGTVSVNGKEVSEPYLSEKVYGECDISFPYVVPDGSVFVLGDNRSVSIDSRSSQVGSVDEGQIIGKCKLRIWPLYRVSGM